MPSRRYGARVVETSNEERVLFPDVGLTKGDLIAYYTRIATTMLPYLRDRPLTMQRFPGGIEEEGFYQKAASDYFPDWIETARLEKRGDGEVEYVVCQNAETLMYLANQNCITPHVWLSRRDRPDAPDRVVFDLDPPNDDFHSVRFATRRVAEMLGDLGLPVFLQLTGSRGIHVVVPIERGPSFREVRAFARDIADTLARDHPDRLTTEQRKARRRGRLYVDTGRNAYGQTIVPPYAVRARSGAPVATPIDLRELDASRLGSRRYTVGNIFRRLGQRGDPWRDIVRRAVSLGPAMQKLRDPGAE